MPYTLPHVPSHHQPSTSDSSAWPYRLAAWLAARFRPRRHAAQPGSAAALLQRLLDRRPAARRRFPHLAAVEDCLQREGPAGLRRLPAHSRARARGELVTLAEPDECVRLLALLATEPEPARRAVPAANAPGIPDVEVTEINEELFYEALREWENPGQHARAHGAGAPDVKALCD
jgi:hypothetical protein